MQTQKRQIKPKILHKQMVKDDLTADRDLELERKRIVSQPRTDCMSERVQASWVTKLKGVVASAYLCDLDVPIGRRVQGYSKFTYCKERNVISHEHV